MNEKIEKLQVRLAKSEQRVEKTQATIERHFKNLEKKIAKAHKMDETFSIPYKEYKYGLMYREWDKQMLPLRNYKTKIAHDESLYDYYWLLCEINRKLDDINGAYKKLAEQLQITSNWENKIQKETQKIETAINAPKVIIDFMDNWERLAIEWHMKNDEFPDHESIAKHIANEKNVKISLLIMRVEKITGKITDAAGLNIGAKGDIVGYIIGENGVAHLQTILCGGWNVQCWHFRTLVHEV